MLSPEQLAAYCGLGVLEGLLVVLPRPARSPRWSRLRSPGWALVLPLSLMVGTFGVLHLRDGATWLATLAAVATPVFVVLAVMGVARGPRWAWLAALPVLGLCMTLHGWPAQLAATALTALGCLAVGAAFVRLTPLPWLLAGIAAMCLVDVVLLGTGVGQPAAGRLDLALSHSSLPEFHRAQLGSMERDYPDLVLAAVFGAALAGHARQLTAAVLVTVFASANAVFFLFADILPATVPLAVAVGALFILERWRGRARRPALTGPRLPAPRDAMDSRGAQPMEA